MGKSSGGVAQLGERVNGIHEVRGSIPLASMAPLRPVSAPTRGSLRGDGRHAKIIRFAGIAQLVEHNLAKVGVAGSSPVSRSRRRKAREVTLAKTSTVGRTRS
jgi:hypothetical protein